jgi:hypothetical protein
MVSTINPDVRRPAAAGPVPNEQGAVHVDAAALWGMLSDLMLCGGRDACLPMLNGVVLHTANDPAGQPVLVGTATDRHILGQAHEPIQPGGSLPRTFVRMAAVRALLAVLTPPDDEPDDEDGADTEPGPAVLSIAENTLALTYAGQSVRVAASPDWYPATAVAGLLTEAEPANRPAVLAGCYLGVLTAIAGRRGGRVVLTVQQPDRPVHAHIGQRFRALVMPIKQQAAELVPPAFFPPATNRGAGA